MSDAPSLRESQMPDVPERRFSVLWSHRLADKGKGSIPWGLIAPHEAQAEKNHYQSLQRLNERGGLSWCEMLAVLEDRKYRQMDQGEARAAVERLVAAYESNRKDGSSPKIQGDQHG